MNCKNLCPQLPYSYDSIQRANRRIGSLAIELLVGVVILAAIFAATIPALNWSFRQQRQSQYRQRAIVVLSNQLDRLTHLPYETLVESEVLDNELLTELGTDYPDPKATIRIVDESTPDAKRIELSVDWQVAPDMRSQKVTLTGWRWK